MSDIMIRIQNAENERDLIAEENKKLKKHLEHLNEFCIQLQKDIHTIREERDRDLVYMNKLLEAVSKGEMKLVEHKKKEEFFLSVVGDKEIN